MAGTMLKLEFAQDAEEQLSTLGEVDRRRLSGWFEHLRNFPNDDSIQKLARRVETYPEEFVYPTTYDWVISFRLTEDAVVITSVFRKRSLQAFEAAGRG